MKKIVSIILLLLVAAGLSIYFWQQRVQVEHIELPKEAYAWVDPNHFYIIAHRLGTEKWAEQNRIATFYKAYENGFRFFEVDLMLTTDNHLICYHGTGYDEDITYQQYVDDSHALNQEACDMDDLVKLAQAHPEIYFTLDVKNETKFEQAYRMIKDKVAKAGVGYSFIPQIYYIHQSPFIREGQVFSAEIFTGYRLTYSSRRIFREARHVKIPVVTIEPGRAIKTPTARGLLIFTQSVNDLNEAIAFKQQGVSGLFTQTLSPKTPELCC